MLLSLVDGVRQKPLKGLKGVCPFCNRPTVAKCGDKKGHHWSHKGKLVCDIWKENEGEWHRKWKAHFPKDNQEVIHYAANGEKHIADVKTHHGWTIEFQHSYLKLDEQKSRNQFYQKIVWVIDGERRKTYKSQFFKGLDEMPPVSSSPLIRKVYLGFCSLLREWNECRVPVIFDFGEESELWFLIPTNDDMWGYVTPITRTDFIKLHEGMVVIDQFLEYLKQLINVLVAANTRRQQQHSARDKSLSAIPKTSQ